jgi:thiamine kinase-like enzyme
MDPNRSVLLSEDKERAVKACAQVLGWDPQSIQLQIMTGGFSSKLILASNDSMGIETKQEIDSKPRKALVRFVSESNPFSALKEAGEAIVFYTYSREKLGPKLWGVFPKTRVEEYIPSRILTPQDFEDEKFYSAFAQKLAAIHCLEVPILKDPQHMLNIKLEAIQWANDFHPNLIGYTPQEKLRAESILKFDVLSFFKWFMTQIPKIQSTVLFTHNDFQYANVLLRDDDTLPIEDRLFVVDVEGNGYFYRGYDFGAHFHNLRLDLPKKGMIQHKGPPSEAQKRLFLREYLKEWRKRNPLTFDPTRDTEDHLLLEATLFEAVRACLWFPFMKSQWESQSFISKDNLLDIMEVNVNICQKVQSIINQWD